MNDESGIGGGRRRHVRTSSLEHRSEEEIWEAMQRSADPLPIRAGEWQGESTTVPPPPPSPPVDTNIDIVHHPAVPHPLRIRLPEDMSRPPTGTIIDDIILPPLDPPPFDPPYALKCVRITQRVRNCEGSHEILILTSIAQSLDEAIKGEAVVHDDDDDDDEGDDDDDDMEGGNDEEEDIMDDISSSFMSSSSSSSDDDDDDDGGRETPPPNNRGFLEAFKVLWSHPIRENRHGGHPTHVYYARKLRREDVDWIETGEAVAIKAVSFQCIRANRYRLSEDFYKEAAALNYLSNGLRGRPIDETHVLTADTIMCSNSHLFIVMPYCDGGDLFERVAEMDRSRLTEDEARFFFRQILKLVLTGCIRDFVRRD
ncbi:hypothetical protein ACHAXA_003832 [Cyclostephanos tholiformis]|uniref:Protein kinase domain-containing protein n=1 Tax=Cyclostephanos tholiformis TaxID=382380 RepID=A0ABD3RLL9_9STRA